jgi:hypothetical protein
MADAAQRACVNAGGVDVRISFDRTEPPVGHVQRLAEPGRSGDSAPAAIEFAGWLGLLRALSEVLSNPEDIPPRSSPA